MHRTISCLFAGLFLSLPTARAQTDPYPIAHNLLLIPNYEYVDPMAMSSNNKEYYTVFVMVFQNKGNVRLPLNDEYEIVTSKGEKHKAGFHPMVKKEIQARRKFEVKGGKFIEPKETRYEVAIFDRLSDSTPSFQFRIKGLPDVQGQPNKFQIVADYDHLKEAVDKNPTNARDATLVWESDPISGHPDRMTARWRTKKVLRLPEQ